MQTATGNGHVMKINISKYLIIPSIIICMILSAGCAANHQNKEKAATHVNMGNAYLKSGHFPSALKEFLAAQSLSQDDPEIHYYTGVSYYGIGLKEKAKKEFKTAVLLKPDYSEAYNYLGNIYLEESLYDNAIKQFELALANIFYETPAIVLNNIGWAYYKKGDCKTALAKYESALKREPRTMIAPIIQKNMGIAYLADHNIVKAMRHLKRSIEMAPGMIESRYWLGMSYLEIHDTKQAIEELRAVVENNPESELGLKAQKKLDDIVQ